MKNKRVIAFFAALAVALAGGIWGMGRSGEDRASANTIDPTQEEVIIAEEDESAGDYGSSIIDEDKEQSLEPEDTADEQAKKDPESLAVLERSSGHGKRLTRDQSLFERYDRTAADDRTTAAVDRTAADGRTAAAAGRTAAGG